jgi:hypothetical protein
MSDSNTTNTAQAISQWLTSRKIRHYYLDGGTHPGDESLHIPWLELTADDCNCENGESAHIVIDVSGESVSVLLYKEYVYPEDDDDPEDDDGEKWDPDPGMILVKSDPICFFHSAFYILLARRLMKIEEDAVAHYRYGVSSNKVQNAVQFDTLFERAQAADPIGNPGTTELLQRCLTAGHPLAHICLALQQQGVVAEYCTDLAYAPHNDLYPEYIQVFTPHGEGFNCFVYITLSLRKTLSVSELTDCEQPMLYSSDECAMLDSPNCLDLLAQALRERGILVDFSEGFEEANE